MSAARSRPADGLDPSGLEFDVADLYDNAPCGFIAATIDAGIVHANRTVVEWLGQGELVGRQFTELLTSASQIFFETRCLPLLRLEGQVREVVLSFRGPDDTEVAALVNAVVLGGSGRPGSIRMAIFDSTKRHDYERALIESRREAEESAERVRVLQEAAIGFGAARSESELGAALVASARMAFTAHSVAVLLTGAPGVLDLIGGLLPTRRSLLIGESFTSSGGPGSDAMRTGEVIALGDRHNLRESYPEFSEELVGARIEAMTATPLMVGDSAVGVVLCFFGRARTFGSELLELHEALARQAADALTRVRLQRQLERMALYDHLTGLANRELVNTRLEEAISYGVRNERPTALIFVDLDMFKPINDVLGHPVGDAVLVEVAARLRASVRDHDVTGRIGGDEFVVICADTDADGAATIAERIRAAIACDFPGIPDEFDITASIGVAVCAPTTTSVASPARLLEVADAAMYASKHAGKNAATISVID